MIIIKFSWVIDKNAKREYSDSLRSVRIILLAFNIIDSFDEKSCK